MPLFSKGATNLDPGPGAKVSGVVGRQRYVPRPPPRIRGGKGEKERGLISFSLAAREVI